MKIKTFIFSAAILVLLFFLYSILSFSRPLDLSRLNFAQRYVLDGINKKWEVYCLSLPQDQRSLLDLGELLQMLGPVQKSLAVRVLSVDPKALGYKGRFISVRSAKDPVKLDNVTFEASVTGTTTLETGIEYLPKHVYLDYKRLDASMFMALKKNIYVDSGYRSAGRQFFLFCYYLANENNYSLRENSKWVSLPGYSQHNDPVNTAVDFITGKGVNNASFEAEPEYKWLQKNAAKFNFYLSYPKDNPFGLSYEPWHWQWVP